TAPDKPLMLRLQTLNDLNGARHIVQNHLDSVMLALPPGQRSLAPRIFKFLVTPSGTKIAQTVSDLADYASLSQANKTRLTEMMETLSTGDRRIFRVLPPPANQKESPRYEVFHDRLAEAIIEWQRRYVEAQRRYRWALVASSLAIVSILMLSLTVFAFRKRNEANAQKAIAL